MFWVTLIFFSLVALVWLRTLVNLILDVDVPPQWTINPGTTPDPVPGNPSLSVIIPARNEEANIERSVRSALALDWPGPLEVIVIDDRSTDRTGEILAAIAAEDDRLKVVMGQEPGEGWLGKPNAVHRGQLHATGDWLWFVDADVELDPQGARLMAGRALAQDTEFASALGKLEIETFWERVLQTRMGAVLAGAQPLAAVNDPESANVLANGQCMMFTRASYDRMGGHEAIKGSVLDDVDFARRAKSLGEPYRLFYGPGVFSCRMYTTFREIWNGWTKNLFPGLEYSLIAVFIVTLYLFMFNVLPFILLAKNLVLIATGQPFPALFTAMEAGIVALILASDLYGHHVRGYKSTYFWSFPIAMLIIIALFWNSAWRITSGRGAVWKGRLVEQGRPAKASTPESGPTEADRQGSDRPSA